jgi:hypothetical protein
MIEDFFHFQRHWWCTLSREYLREFSNKFEMAVISVVDPGSGAFLTLDPDPGSGIGFFPDPGSQPHIFQSLVTNFEVKSSTILWKLA